MQGGGKSAFIADEPQMRVEGPLADALSLWTSVRVDLEFADKALALLAARPVSEDHSVRDQDTVAVALWNAALVAYARCFDGWRQVAGHALEASMSPEQRVIHRRLLDRRNSHVAHLRRHSETEQFGAFASVDSEGNVVLQAIGEKLVMEGKHRVAESRQHLQVLMKFVSGRQKAAFGDVESRLRGMPAGQVRKGQETGRLAIR